MQAGLSRLIDPQLGALAEESRAFYVAKAKAAQPQPDLSTAQGMRQARESRAGAHGQASLAAESQVAQAGGRDVPVRVIAPAAGSPVKGVHLDIHGGGFYLGTAASHDVRNARLARALDVVVVSVDYRLAPEHPWPAAPDDCETAARWLTVRAESLFGTSRLTIGGASAGATLAMTTLLRLHGQGLAGRFAGAALEYGAWDLSGQTPGGRRYAGEYFIQAYAGHAADRTDPDISPLYGSLAGLPPVLMVVGALDILLDDNLAMAARLCAAGNDLDVRVYPESPHGFSGHPTAMAGAALTGIESWLAARLASAAS